MRFEWDPRKADANLRAHGISFAEAVTVLEDAFALTREDPDVVEEQRFDRDIIRMIAAWKANKRQKEVYEEGRS